MAVIFEINIQTSCRDIHALVWEEVCVSLGKQLHASVLEKRNGLIHHARTLCAKQKDLLDTPSLLKNKHVAGNFWQIVDNRGIVQPGNQNEYFDVSMPHLCMNSHRDCREVQHVFVLKKVKTLYSNLFKLTQRREPGKSKNGVVLDNPAEWSVFLSWEVLQF